MYRFYKGSTLNTTASGTTTGTAGMTGLTTGATNACTVRAIDRAGNEGDPYAINVPTKLYRWDIYSVINIQVAEVSKIGDNEPIAYIDRDCGMTLTNVTGPKCLEKLTDIGWGTPSRTRFVVLV